MAHFAYALVTRKTLYYDCFNGVIYRNEETAQRAREGGNTIIEITFRELGK
jgi:hypothetical protein